MEDNAKGSRKLLVGVGLCLAVIAGWFLFNGLPGGSSLSQTELVALKNRGLASAENIPNKLKNDGTESMKLFTQLVKETPDAMLGVRNLAVAGVLAVEKQYAKREEAPQKYAFIPKK